ncbi:uncharacterized protein LOC130715380 isoform X2 [Lotus japonicus]|uniref:uncharacterized protein LOC130715380 isoform X2 n=1 Tax=Lotus japonicus TaxID=34305 RepID=UPI00258F92BE|nr:uncharacterized protein LOC130715380 isoform X2 [Lotus japonicus]
MAFDRNSVVKDLHAVNVVPVMAEEPLISPASIAATPHTPNSARDLFYPPPPVGAWYVRPAAAAAHPAAVGFNYGSPNSFGNMAAAPGNALNLGNWAGVNGSCNDGSPHGSSRTGGGDDGGDDSVSGRKVKFLCSFGGRILPRPNDGVLRYVGGQTRIISVRKDVSFSDLVQKMVDTYGQPVAIKYQLPEEELDALVSVSCADDVDNMMEEYEKLVERSPDGSAKLRVFLFSASEADLSGVMQSVDLQDTGQRYFEAVNGFTDGNGISGGIKRKESVTSAASTQNSDLSGIETLDSSFSSQWEPVSCAISSKENVAASPDTSANLGASEPNSAAYSAASAVSLGMPVANSSSTPTTYSQNEVDLEKPVPVSQQPFGLQQYGMEIPPSSHYLQPLIDLRPEVRNHADYVQLHPQAGFPNPQLLGQTGPSFTQQQFNDNASGLAFHQAIPGAQIPVTQPYSHAAVRPNVIQQQTLMQPQHNRLDQYSDESASGLRIMQLPAEHSYNTYQVPVNHAPSVIAGGNYGWVQVPPQEQVVFSDGLLPQQQILIPEQLNRVEGCSMCKTKLPHAHSDPVVQDQHNGGAGPVPDSSPTYRSFPVEDSLKTQGTNMFKHMVTAPLESISEHGAGTGSRLASKVEPSDGVPCNNNSTGLSHNLVPLPEGGRNIMQKPEEFDHAKNSFLQETTGRTGAEQSPSDGLMTMGTAALSYPEAVHRHVPVENGVKQDVVVNKPVNNDIPMVDRTAILTSKCMIQGSPRKNTNEFTGVVSKSDVVDNWIRQDHLKRVDGRMDTLKICNPEVDVSNDDCLLPLEKPNGNDKLDYNTRNSVEGEVILDNNFGRPKLVAGSNQIKMTGVLPCSSEEISFGHNSRPGEYNEVARPPVVGNTVKDDTSSSSLSSSVRFGDVQNSPNSLFSNQDPWAIQHGTFFPPARPNNTTLMKETYSPRDHFGENPGSFGKQISEAQLDEGLYQSFIQNLTFEHGQSAKGSTEEEEQLQAVAEDVAASVLHPCSPPNPNLHAEDVSSHENIEDCDVQNNLIDDAKSKPPEKACFGFPASGVGRLQVIKNCHLEELTELGSGTFGTVYHGKWRGTDVAIKRITDRCFAGKPSEQERMRDDFWNEAIKLADLHHPNVVAFYGVVLDGPGGSVATVTEYMANGSLRNALQKSERNLDKRKRLIIAMDVAFGMEYLHGKNIVHFDLKSDNLLVNLRDPHRPICKVGDLGLSKVKCQTLISGGVRGTLPWMAPELLNGSSSLVSEKVDVFSFGIVLWELLTGEEPYADLHYGAIIGGIVSNTLRPLVPESCDSEWRSLMERCWSSEPSERPGFPEIVNELRSMAAKRHNQQLPK